MVVWSGRRVLVTVGAGFIRSHLNSCSVETWGFEAKSGVRNSWFLQNMSLVEMLVADNARVRVISRRLRKGSLGNLATVRGEIEFLAGNISRIESARRAVRIADPSKPRQLIGYEPQALLEEGLVETIAWYHKAWPN